MKSNYLFQTIILIPKVDDVLRHTSPLHPPPKISAGLKLDDDLDIGPITKRVLANDYNRILHKHGSKKFGGA